MTNQNSKVDKDNKKTEENNQKDVINETKPDASIEELENQNKRVLADYRNLENRVSQERGEWILKANKSLLLNLLPVLDTLILANKHSQGKDQNLSLSIQQFLDILKREGVVKIEAQGQSFDPNLMECIETVEGIDGKVTEEVRAGYTLYDEILRVAQVKVGKGK